MSKTGLKLKNLIQPPLNTTLMGVLKAAADYYGLEKVKDLTAALRAAINR
jgi:hypothetical protein